jgi:hypothetical protein
VIPGDGSPEPRGVAGEDPEEGLRLVDEPFCDVEAPAAPRSAMLTCSAGTFHVARYVYGFSINDARNSLWCSECTYQDLAKRSSSKHIVHLILLFLACCRGLRQHLLGDEREHRRRCCCKSKCAESVLHPAEVVVPCPTWQWLGKDQGDLHITKYSNPFRSLAELNLPLTTSCRRFYSRTERPLDESPHPG